MYMEMCHCGLKLIGNMHQPRPLYRTFEALFRVRNVKKQVLKLNSFITVAYYLC